MRLRRMWLLATLVLAGCASNVPVEVRQAPVVSVSIAEVLPDPERFRGTTVRWGGTIAAVTNRESDTLVEVVARDLQSGGRPQSGGRSDGRFVARFAGFVDPLVYAAERELTVAGVLDGALQADIGEYPYRFPVVAVRSHHLWEPLPPPDPWDYYDPWWPHGPWYPYHPWRRYPYWW